jgi:hypothetical protein
MSDALLLVVRHFSFDNFRSAASSAPLAAAVAIRHFADRPRIEQDQVLLPRHRHPDLAPARSAILLRHPLITRETR